MLPHVSFRKYFSGDAMMLDLKSFIARHGEPVAQALIENLERYEGLPRPASSSLEDRWKTVMGKSQTAEPHGEA